jgi:hypothetical protein
MLHHPSSVEAENKVLKRIKEEQKEDACYGKSMHGRSLDDIDVFEAELNKKSTVTTKYISYERDDHGSEFTSPLLVKALPEAVRQRLDNMEDLCFYGILSLDIHPLAWVSVDNSLCLWIPPLTLSHPPSTRVVHVKDYITSVALVKSNPGKSYASDGTPPYFLAVALRECIQLFQIYLTDTELVVRETAIEIAVDSFVCKMVSTDNGRLFVGCKDGNVYEIDFAEADDSLGSLFFSRKSRKTNCNRTMSVLSAPMAVFSVMRDVLLGAKPQEPVAFLVYDSSRQIIIALTQSKAIGTASGSEGGSSSHVHAFFLDSRGFQGEMLCERRPPAYRGPFSLLSESHIVGMDAAVREYHMEEFIALHPISKEECSKLNAVIISSTGCRFYLSISEQDGISCRAVRPPPITEQGGWASPGTKSAKVTASAYQHGLWLATCSDKSKTSGSLFCISQDRNCPSRTVSLPLNQSAPRKAEVVTSFSANTQNILPANIWSVLEVPPSYWYSNTNSGSDGSCRMLSTHELFEQHVVQQQKFVVLCRNGIFVVSRRQPWEKLEYYLSRFSELVSSPDKLCKALRFPKEQLCATAILWWVRSGATIDDGLAYPKAIVNDAQSRAVQLFSSIEKLEAGRGGLGLLIALSRFLRPVWSSSSVNARDWCRVAAELDLVKRFVETSGSLEILSPRKGLDRQQESKDAIRHVEVLETISHCQQLCSLLYLVVKGGGSLACLQQGGLGLLIQNYYKNMRGLGPDPILDLVRSLSEASCNKGSVGSKKARWSYEDTPVFREGLLLSRVEQEHLDALLTRLLPPAKLAQARADKELSRARALYDSGDLDGVSDSVRKAQEQLMGIARELTTDDLRRYSGCTTQDSPSTSFRYIQQPIAFLEIVLHRFANQSVVASEEVLLTLEFIQDIFHDVEGTYGSDIELDAALQLIIQHNGLYRNAQFAVSSFLDRSGAGLQSLQASKMSSFNLSLQSSYSEEKEERAMWPLLRGMIEPHWKAYVEERERPSHGRSGVVEPDVSCSLALWSRLVKLVGTRYIESPQLGSKALLEVECFLRSHATVSWLNERAQKDSCRMNMAEWFLSHCQGELLQAAGLFAKAGHLCYLRAKQVSDASLEDRIESLLEAKKAAAFNGGQLPQAQVSVSSLEFEAALAMLQLQLKKRSGDEKYGKILMAIGALFEACCAEGLFDLALDLCALSAAHNEVVPTSVVQPLWRNMLDQAAEEGNTQEVLRQQGRKFLKREGFFPLGYIISLLEDKLDRPAEQNMSGAGGTGIDASGLLLEIGVAPLRVVQAYVERLDDGRLDARSQRRCVQVVVGIYVDMLERALQSGQEALLPVTSIENDLLRLETHPALRSFRPDLVPARGLLDRLRSRLATTRV